MSKLTKEQWTQIETKLSGIFGLVDLLIDGYKVTFSIQKFKMRLVIQVYINGWFKGEWLQNGGSEEARRFFFPKKYHLHSAKYRKLASRMSKKRRESLMPGWDKTHIVYWPWWTSFKALKAHLIKNNQSIELIEEKKEAESA